MSETTPRPWRAERRTYRHFDGTSDIAAILDANGVWFTPTPTDAELIVRAVNQYDALVEFVEAVRGIHRRSPHREEFVGPGGPYLAEICEECLVEYPCATTSALWDLDLGLDTKIGGQDD